MAYVVPMHVKPKFTYLLSTNYALIEVEDDVKFSPYASTYKGWVIALTNSSNTNYVHPELKYEGQFSLYTIASVVMPCASSSASSMNQYEIPIEFSC